MCYDPRQDPRAVQKWKEDTLPQLREQAARENRVLCYADESSVLLNPKGLGTYWVKNEELRVACWDKQFQTYGVCGAISSEGDFVYQHQEENFTGKDMVAFLKLLLEKVPKKVTLIWDGASIHDCKVVRDFLEELPQGRLLLVKQPTYSPELNASEQVWHHLKNVMLSNRAFENINALRKELCKALERMKEKTHLIRRFFHHPNVAFY